MKLDTDPCDDFYEFVCGGFVNKTVIPDDRSSVTEYTIVRDDLKKQINESLAEEIQPNDSKTFKMVKTLYKSCMNKCKNFF